METNSNRKRPRQDNELCSPSATSTATAGQREDTQQEAPPAVGQWSRREELRRFFENDFQVCDPKVSYKALLVETPLAKLRREYDEAQKKAERSQRAADHQEPTEVQTTEQPEEMSSAVSSGTEAQLRSAVEDSRQALRKVERSGSSNFGWETLCLGKIPINFAVVDRKNNCRLPKAEVVVLSLFHAGLLRPHYFLGTSEKASSTGNGGHRLFDVAFTLRLTLLLGEARGELPLGIEVNESYYRSVARPPPNMPCMLASGFANCSGDEEQVPTEM